MNCQSIRRSVVFLSTTLATSIAQAEPAYGPWRSSRIGGGGYVQQVAIAPSDPNRLYTYVDMAGAYRSDDGGMSWRMIHAGLPPVNGGYDVRGANVDPRDADHLFLAVGNHRDHAFGVFESRDGGATYALVCPAIFSGNGNDNRAAGQVIDRSPTHLDILIAGEYDGVRRSDDNGKTWRAIGLDGHQITDLRFDRTDDRRIFACAQPYVGLLQGKDVAFPEAFFRSDDGGATWQKLADRSPSEIVQSAGEPNRLFGIFGAAEVFESTDLGATWTCRSHGLPTNPADLGSYTSRFRYRLLATGPTFLLAGNSAGEFYRLDRGETTWRRVERTAIDNPRDWSHGAEADGDFGHAMAFALVDPCDARHWIMTDWYAVWHTFDAGATWRLGIDGYEPTYVFHVLPDPRRANVVHLAVSDNGYLRSEDGGATFRRDVRGITSQVRDVDASPAEIDRVYAVGASAAAKGQWHVDQLFVSDDDGHSWRASPMTGLPPLGAKRFAASVTADLDAPDTVYLGVSGDVAAGDGGPYRSVDGGQTWQWFGDGLPARKPLFRSLFWGAGRQIQSIGGGKLLCLAGDHLFRWSDGRWSAVLTTAATFASIAVDPTTSGRVLASAGKAGIWRSNDFGATWTNVASGDAGSMAWDATTPGHALAATADANAGLRMTTDAGTTWAMLDQRLPMRVGLRPAFVSGRPIVGTAGSGVFCFEPATRPVMP